MSKALLVPLALQALIRTALPLATVLGPDDETSAAAAIAAAGRVIVGAGDPGDPDIDLCPLTYNYDHQIPVTFTVQPGSGQTPAQALAGALAAVSAAMKADRTLGGLVDFIDAFAPAASEIFEAGASPARGADAMFTATYSTTDPL